MSGSSLVRIPRMQQKRTLFNWSHNSFSRNAYPWGTMLQKHAQYVQHQLAQVQHQHQQRQRQQNPETPQTSKPPDGDSFSSSRYTDGGIPPGHNPLHPPPAPPYEPWGWGSSWCFEMKNGKIVRDETKRWTTGADLLARVKSWRVLKELKDVELKALQKEAKRRAKEQKTRLDEWIKVAAQEPLASGRKIDLVEMKRIPAAEPAVEEEGGLAGLVAHTRSPQKAEVETEKEVSEKYREPVVEATVEGAMQDGGADVWSAKYKHRNVTANFKKPVPADAIGDVVKTVEDYCAKKASPSLVQHTSFNNFLAEEPESVNIESTAADDCGGLAALVQNTRTTSHRPRLPSANSSGVDPAWLCHIAGANKPTKTHATDVGSKRWARVEPRRVVQMPPPQIPTANAVVDEPEWSGLESHIVEEVSSADSEGGLAALVRNTRNSIATKRTVSTKTARVSDVPHLLLSTSGASSSILASAIPSNLSPSVPGSTSPASVLNTRYASLLSREGFTLISSGPWYSVWSLTATSASGWDIVGSVSAEITASEARRAATSERRTSGGGLDAASTTRAHSASKSPVWSDAEYTARKNFRAKRRELRMRATREAWAESVAKKVKVHEGKEKSLLARVVTGGVWMGGLVGLLGLLANM